MQSTKYPLALLVVLTLTLQCPLYGVEPPGQDPGQGQKDNNSIRIVSTWKELAQQEPIALEGGVQVRLGIESLECPRWSAVTLYCLTQRFTPPIRWKGNRLGPLRVSSKVDGRPQGEGPDLGSRDNARLGEVKNGQVLYALPIGIDLGKEIEISVLTEDGKELGKAVVKRSAEAFHPWTAFEKMRVPEDTGDDTENVVNRADAAALPQWSGMIPIVFKGTLWGRPVALPEESRLPTLVPKDAKPALKLTVNQGLLTVESADDIVMSWPDELFLARWWVNGRPFVPEKVVEEGSIHGFNAQGAQRGKRVRFRLHLNLARVGAMKGDTIGLQLLYCDCGWDSVSDGFGRGYGLSTTFPTLLNITNRVEFLAP